MRKTISSILIATSLTFLATPASAGIFDNIKDIILQLDEDNIPTRSSYFKYTNTDFFDAKLHVSLKYNYHTVSVDMNTDYSVKAMPERMDRWLAKSRDKRAQDINGNIRNGRVLVCTPGSADIELLSFLAKKLFSIARFYVTYKPVDDYDAYIMLDDLSYVEEVKFFHKRSDRTRPTGCKNYFDYVDS